MGRQADRKLKRRRRDQKHQRTANVHEQLLVAELQDEAVQTVAAMAEAAPADAKAAHAALAEWLDTVAANPEAAAATVEYMRQTVRRPDRLVRPDLARTAPKVARGLAEAAHRVMTTVNPLCPHIAEAIMPGYQCATHPDLGVICNPCLVEHVSTHPRAEEFRCDQCGRVTMGHIIPITPHVLTGMAVMRPSEDTPRRFPGPVTITGWGLCDRCFRKR